MHGRRFHTRKIALTACVFFAFVLAANDSAAGDEKRDSFEEVAMIGLASTGDYLGTAPTFEFEVGGRHQLDDSSFGIALRARYEHYDTTGAVTLDESLVTLEVPVTARLGSANGTIFPYLGIAPGLIYDRANVTATIGKSYANETSGRLSLHGFAGTQLRLGPGGIFFEWGFRISPVEHRAEGDSSLTSFVGSVGYRLTL